MPSTIERSLGPPLSSSAAGCSSSASRFRMSQWLSLTRTALGPGGEGALDGRVGLARHQAAESVILSGMPGIDRVGLILVNDAGYAFHIDGDVDPH